MELLLRRCIIVPACVEQSLHALCRTGNVNAIHTLLVAAKEGGYEERLVDAKDSAGNTLLMAAALRGHLDLLVELLRSGAAVDSPNQQQGTALHKVNVIVGCYL